MKPAPPLRSPTGSTPTLRVSARTSQNPRTTIAALGPLRSSTDHSVIGPPKERGGHRSPPPTRTTKVQNPRSAACPVTSSSKATSPATPTAATAKTPARPTPTSTSPSPTASATTNGEWVDGPPTYYRVTVFGKTAENALNSLTKGNTVIATGELTVRNYTRTDGTPGIAHEIIADHLGAALTYTSVTINPKTANRDQLTELPVEAATHPPPTGDATLRLTADDCATACRRHHASR